MSLSVGRSIFSVVFLFTIIIFNIAPANSNGNLKIPDFYSEPGQNKGRAYENGMANESIDPFSGGLSLQYQDMVLPGNGGMDIVINRIYRSLQGAENYLNERHERRVTGIGWDIHFGRVWFSPNTVMCDSDTQGFTTGPNLPSSYRNPVFEASDGSRKVMVTEYDLTTPYHMISKDRWTATCIPAAENAWNSNINGMVVQSPDGMKYTLGTRGRVEIGNQETNLPLQVNLIENRNGNWIAIYYDKSTSYSRIDNIKTSDGRYVKFEYTKGVLNEDVRLDRIVAYPDGETEPAQRTWTYHYTQAVFTTPNSTTSPWYLLTRVESPDPTVDWDYTYYPDDVDGFLDSELKFDPERFSLKSITLPEGAKIDYQYTGVVFDTRLSAFGTTIMTTAVSSKTQSGATIDDGTWSYYYRPYSVTPANRNEASRLTSALDALIGDYTLPSLDETEVRGPQYCTTYKHVGLNSITFNANDGQDDGVWTVGLMLERKKYEGELGKPCSGTILEKETIKWDKQFISEMNEFRPSRSAIDENTYAPVMVEKTIERNATDFTSGTPYVTTFSNHDVYGNPWTIVETGQDTRTTNYEYEYNQTKWLLKLVNRETINGIPGEITRVYDSGNGDMLSETKYGVATNYLYHVTGDVYNVKDARGFNKYFGDYKRGISQSESHQVTASGYINTSRVVNGTGTVKSETNGRGKTTQYTYDNLNRITSITLPIGAVTNITRPDANTTELTRGGFKKTEKSDGLGRVTSTSSFDSVSNSSITKTVNYDNIGNKYFESYPNSTNGITSTYDGLGRLLTQSEPTTLTTPVGDVTTRITYLDGILQDSNYIQDGNKVQVTDPRGRITSSYYRSYGSPGQRSLIRTESPESIVTTTARNKLGLVTGITQGGFTRIYNYDSRHYLNNVTHPEIGLIQYVRDALGNKTSETYGTGVEARTNGYSYDGLNRLTLVDYDGATLDITYTYDGNSNLDTLRRGDTTWIYGYDDNDNLTSEYLHIGRQQSGNQQLNLSYQYDTLDALKQVTYPSNIVVNYAPNDYGWPTQASGFVTSVNYHPSGHIKDILYANGVQQSIVLNPRLLPSDITAAGIVGLDYQYDLAGNISSISDAITPTNNVYNMIYDGVNRLKTATGAWGDASFNYDLSGNLTSKTFGAQTQTHVYNPATNRLDSITGSFSATLGYDVFGNVTADGNNVYAYDDSSDLIQIIAGRTVNLTYDGNKRRTIEVTPDTTVYTVYNKAGQLMYEYDVANDASKEYIRIGANLVAIRKEFCNVTSVDDDGDGIPTCMEDRYGLDPNDPTDANLDNDFDGLTNLQEITNGLDPNDAADASLDNDSDGLTNLQEITNGLDLNDPTDASKDNDSDGITNLQEIIYGLNLNDPTDANLDKDSDGLTNLQEVQLGINPTLSDTDADGMGDGYEVQYGFNPSVSDSANDNDGDGYTNLQEYNGASDPFDPLSIPNGEVKWSVSVPGVASFPAVKEDGTIYLLVADSVGAMSVYAYNQNGAQLWTTNLPVSGPGCAVYKDTGYPTYWFVDPTLLERERIAGQVSVGTDGAVYASCDGGGTFALDSAGTLLWSNPAGGHLAITSDRVYVSTEMTLTAELHAFDTMGNLLWTYSDFVAPFGYSPVVAESGVIYAVSGCTGDRTYGCIPDADGTTDVYAINPDGTLRWQNKDVGVVRGKLSIGIDDSLYFGTYYQYQPDNASRLIAINADGSLQRALTPSRADINYEGPSGYTDPTTDTSGNIYALKNRPYWFYPDFQLGGSGRNFENTGRQSIVVGSGGYYYAVAQGYLQSFSTTPSDIPWPTSGNWRRSDAGPVNLSDLNMTPDGSLIGISANLNSSTLYGLVNNDGVGLSESIWPIQGGNARQTNSVVACDATDQDGDGLSDCIEKRVGMNPNDATDAGLDSDFDGLTDLAELTSGSHPFNADTDGDGITDDIEVAQGMDPRSNTKFGDTDGDGAVDAIEMLIGTLPNDDTSTPVVGTLIWQQTLTAPLVSAPVHQQGNKLLWFTDQPEPVFGGLGDVDILTGANTILWRKSGGFNPDPTPPAFTPVDTMPVIVSENFVFGTSLAADNGNFIFINLMDEYNSARLDYGTQIAKGFALDSAGDTYFGSSPNTLYKLGSYGGTGLQWSQTLATDITTSPVINANDIVIVATADGIVHGFDTTGVEIWTFAMSGSTNGSPAIGSDGTVYIGSADGNLYALASDTGTQVWSYNVGAVLSTATVIGADNTIYVTSENGFLYAINPDGTLKWNYQTTGAIRSDPVIGVDNNIYFGSDDSNFYVVSPAGTLVHQIPLGSPAGAASPYIDPRGVLLTGTADNRLLAIYVGTAGIANTPWPTVGHDVHRTSNVTTNLQSDQSPALSVVTPTPAQSFNLGDTVVFSATAADPEDGDIAAAISWTSSLDGALGNGSPLNVATLTVGQHDITATVIDSGANSVSTSVTIDVVQPGQTPTLSISDVTVSESDGQASFTVSLLPTSSSTVTVDVASSDISALAPADYTAVPLTTLTFTPGQTSKTVNVTIVDDLDTEGSETFNVTLSNATNAPISQTTGIGTILDNEVSPCGQPAYDKATEAAVFIWQNCTTQAWSIRMTAGGQALTYAGNLAADQAFTSVAPFSQEADDVLDSTTDPTRIDFSQNVANTGQDGFDFTLAGGASVCLTKTGPNGIPVLLGASRSPMPDSFSLTTLAACAAALPSLSIDDVMASEGDGQINFNVSLSAASTSTVTVDVTTADGSAVAPGDYAAVTTTTLTFNPGVTSLPVSVLLVDDSDIEGDETFSVNLTSPVNGLISKATGTGTIQDNDTLSACGQPVYDKATEAAVFIWQNCATGTWSIRMTAGGQALTYAGNLAADQAFTSVVPFSQEAGDILDFSTDPTRIDFSQIVGSAGQDGFDFTLAGGASVCLTKTGPNGIPVFLGASRSPMPDSFSLTTLAACAAALPSLSIDDVTTAEGDGQINFNVSLSAASTSTVTVDVTTADGSAVAPGDYAAVTTTTLTFNPGVTSLPVSVLLVDDSDIEGDETFSVNLTSPVNGLISKATGTGTIQDNDTLSACGQPVYDKATEAAVFIWQNCATGTWSIRMTAGGQALTYAGNLAADQAFTSVLPFSQEAGDILDYTTDPTRIDFSQIVGSAGQDGFDFTLAGGASVCLTKTGPNGIPVLLGASRSPMPDSFSLTTLGVCP